MKLVPFGAYALLQLAVGLSRIFVLAHFPHQVVAGILTGELGNTGAPSPPLEHPLIHPAPRCPGAALGRGLQAWTPTAHPPGFFVATALALLLGSLSLHSLVLATGFDIDW